MAEDFGKFLIRLRTATALGRLTHNEAVHVLAWAKANGLSDVLKSIPDLPANDTEASA